MGRDEHVGDRRRRKLRGDDRGQASVALIGVIILGALCIVGLAWVGEAIAHRAHARTAADAIALATAADPGQGDALAGWYRSRGLDVEQQGDRTYVASGPSQAAAWAGVTDPGGHTAPALQAIVARAEQLIGNRLVSVSWHPLAFDLNESDAAAFDSVAGEFSLCRDANLATSPGRYRFTWC